LVGFSGYNAKPLIDLFILDYKDMEVFYMTKEENYIRAIEFRFPEYIPCSVALMPGTWSRYREDLEDLVTRHPIIFGDYKKGSRDFDKFSKEHTQGAEYTDEWGCVWENIQSGLVGQVVGHPIKSWDEVEDFEAPDPMAGRDWDKVSENLRKARDQGKLARGGGLPHGFMFQRLYYLIGFENFMMGIADDLPEVRILIEKVFSYNMAIINKYLELGANFMAFGDDMGNQVRLPMSPEQFRKYLIEPCFSKLFGACKRSNAHVYLHSDGHIMEIIGDLAERGVTVINPQIRANTLDGLVRECKDKVCVNLDLDRQLFPFCTPDDIDEHIKEATMKLGSERGGLMLHAECDPDVPLENIEAICQALEKYRLYWS
jgi:hypothetical protein